jgi:hypothetical protein
VVSEAEYRLEIDDDEEEWEYIKPTDPGPYNSEITGDEDEHVIKCMEAEHNQKQIDYQKYLGVQEHLRREFTSCMDPTWITALRKNRSGFANVTIHQFLAHFRANVAKLTSKQKNEISNGTSRRIFKSSSRKWRRSKSRLKAGGQQQTWMKRHCNGRPAR